MTQSDGNAGGATITQADMAATLTSQGGMRRFDVGGISMIQHPATELEPGLAGLWLHREEESVRLTGAGSSACVHTCADGCPAIIGQALGIRYRIDLHFQPETLAWVWQISLLLDETESGEVAVRLAHTQDVGLAPYPVVRNNEYYVSQYLDLTPVAIRDHGTAVAVRQNMPSDRAPWVLIGALGVGEQWATDARQLLTDRGGRPVLDPCQGLPSSRSQGEHTVVALACAPITLRPGESCTTGFFGVLVPDHPAATSADDQACADAALEFASSLPQRSMVHGVPPATSMFDLPVFIADDLDEATVRTMWEGDHSLVEFSPDGQLWSFHHGDGSAAEVVTLAGKEQAVLRPHGHMLRTGSSLAPDTELLTSTIWMAGVFASQVSQGHVNRGVAISGRRGYLGLMQAHGLRIFVDIGEGLQLLMCPSAWALRPDQARWVYCQGSSRIDVVATAPTDRHVLGVSVTAHGVTLRRVVVAGHVALCDDAGQVAADLDLRVDGDGARISHGERSFSTHWHLAEGTTIAFGGDEMLFDDQTSRNEPWFVAQLGETDEFSFDLALDTVPRDQRRSSDQHLPDLWHIIVDRLSVSVPAAVNDDVAVLNSSLRWFAHNALIHYLSPRGLEQFSGGGWGTRDVSQGPIGLLTALAADEAQRTTLIEVFTAQNARGDWPQAFDFLPPQGRWAPFDSHGDVVFWPLLATGEYLQLTADSGFLLEEVPFSEAGPSRAQPIAEHLTRALDHIEGAALPGSPLPAYGHGDWNDSLQPADPMLASQMVSSWTAVLQIESLRQLVRGLRCLPRDLRPAEHVLATRATGIADATEQALRSLLLVDGELAGYGLFTPSADDRAVELMVHPHDTRTGLSHGILPWIHAISGQHLTPSEAERHLDLISRHLLGPDGARLFDRPAAYRGGPMKVFQRAEGATFWGREIGLMYTHAHLRYVEALATLGRADECWRALLQVCPTLLTQRLPQARPRQNTCYYSSSDAVFADRYVAERSYDQLMAGEVDLEGGWRIYSSGPGLFLRLVTETVLGVKRRGPHLELDPVLPVALDGLVARVPVPEGHVQVTYRVRGSGVGVGNVIIDGVEVPTRTLSHRYRSAGVIVDTPVRHGSELTIEVGRDGQGIHA